MNNKLRGDITFHDALHGYSQGRGTGTATMEAKLAQKIEVIVHEPLFQVIIDVQKSYDYFDRSLCVGVLRRYGLGNNLQRLLQRYWDKQKVAPKARK